MSCLASGRLRQDVVDCKILTTARSQLYLSLLEMVYISWQKIFMQAKAVCIDHSTVLIKSEPAVTR